MTHPGSTHPDAALRTPGPVAGPAAALDPVPALGAGATMRTGGAIARYGVAITLLAIGLLKFTAAEADGIQPLVASSPLLRWMYAVWSTQTASRLIGVVELLAALGLALRPVSARAASVGSALAVGTFLATLSFFATAPGVWDATHGFPFLGGSGQFLVKDVVLLGASVWSLGEARAATRHR